MNIESTFKISNVSIDRDNSVHLNLEEGRGIFMGNSVSISDIEMIINRVDIPVINAQFFVGKEFNVTFSVKETV